MAQMAQMVYQEVWVMAMAVAKVMAETEVQVAEQQAEP
jgi:hypothetical protein